MSDNRARLWFSLFVVAVFCLGGAVGLFAGRHLPPALNAGRVTFDIGPGGPPPPVGLGRRGGPGRFGRGPGGPPPLPPDVIAGMGTELKLDAGQQDRINKILDEHRAHLYAIHREALDKFEKERQDLQNAVRGVLRPDQQEKFQRFLERRP